MVSEHKRTQLTEAHDRLKAITADLMVSDTWAQLLRMQRKFHQYSWNNTLLIYGQCPHATRVAGYNTWKDLGRQVRKGEKAIKIFAPRPYTKTDDDGNEETRVSFSIANVFDYSQTDAIEGHPNPYTLGAEDRPIVTDDAGVSALILDNLAEWVRSEGLTLTIEADAKPGRGGYYSPPQKRINITPASPASMARVLIHEAAHYLTVDPAYDYLSHEPYAENEVIAESVAYIVCDHYGLAADAVSAEYLASWTQDDPKRINAGVQKIMAAAERIIDALGDLFEDDDEERAAHLWLSSTNAAPELAEAYV